MKSIDLSDGEVQLWWASLDVNDSEINRLRKTLAPAELQRAERFRVSGAGRRFIAARAALRRVLAASTGTAASDLEFHFGPNGKPHLADGGLSFNASDSGDFVVVALAGAEVGVDIELKRSVARRERLARRICTEREIELLQRTPEDERDERLLRLWTCKEAALKAIGIGLPGGVRNIEATIPPEGPPTLTRCPGGSNGWSLHFADLHPNLLCSVVVRGSGWRAVERAFSLDTD
jgi:4'-phosphopantetheinyl transferase